AQPLPARWLVWHPSARTIRPGAGARARAARGTPAPAEPRRVIRYKRGRPRTVVWGGPFRVMIELVAVADVHDRVSLRVVLVAFADVPPLVPVGQQRVAKLTCSPGRCQPPGSRHDLAVQLVDVVVGRIVVVGQGLSTGHVGAYSNRRLRMRLSPRRRR